MSFNQIERNNCILCDSDKLITLKTLNDFPVFMGLGDGDESTDIKCDLVFDCCEECEGVQLSRLMPLDIVYGKSHGSGVIGHAWQEHHSAFAKFVSEFVSKKESVLEIGGGHGFLSSFCYEKGIKNWTVIEPNPGDYYLDHVVVQKGFFGVESLDNEKYEYLVHSHLFEHVYDPIEFVSEVKNKLTKDGRVIFSIPNMDAMLSKGYTNMLNFEHTYFLSENVVTSLMNAKGFRLIESRNYLTDHSVFYCFELSHDKKINTRFIKEKNVKLKFNEYFNKLTSDAININHLLSTLSYEKAFCFGGHVFSQYLFSYGVDHGYFTGLLDNDTNKHDGRLYGSNLIISSPDIIGQYSQPLVVTSHTGVYRSEIEAQLKKINKNVLII